jgi:hypothetical protein
MKKPIPETLMTIDGVIVKYWRIKNDSNGNPRYVVHFSAIDANYEEALVKARKIGGRKYTAKWFGGGLVFKSYNLSHELSLIIF